MNNTLETIRRRFDEHSTVVAEAAKSLTGAIAEAAGIVTEAYRNGGGVLVLGNGGSAADAQHIAGELVGRFLADRSALKAQALSTDTSILTCLGNDFGFESIFSRQIEANGSPGDVAIALSTSGNSPNVIAALKAAREAGMKTIAFTGAGGGQCADLADVLLEVPSTSAPRVQEVHAIAYHILCELVEGAISD